MSLSDLYLKTCELSSQLKLNLTQRKGSVFFYKFMETDNYLEVRHLQGEGEVLVRTWSLV